MEVVFQAGPLLCSHRTCVMLLRLPQAISKDSSPAQVRGCQLRTLLGDGTKFTACGLR
jgi:hypothetical protein